MGALPKVLETPRWDTACLQQAIELGSRESALTRADSRIIESENWYQILTPSRKDPRFNAVLLARLEEREASARIRSTLDSYRELELPFRWEAGPLSRPADLGRRLQTEGVALDKTLSGLAIDLSELKLGELPAGTEVGLVGPEPWVRTAIEGWGFPDTYFTEFRDDVRKRVREAPGKRFHFQARYQGEPAASASVTILDLIGFEFGYLHSASVIPRFRRQGVYRALLSARLGFLADRGIPLAVTQTLPSSTPACLGFGFRKFCEIPVHRWPPGQGTQSAF